MLTQVEHRPEVNTNHVLAVPVTRHLLRQTITKAGYENRNDLRLCLHDQLSHARLRAQERVRIVTLVPRSFRMKADYVSGSRTRQIYEQFKRKLVKDALLRQRVI